LRVAGQIVVAALILGVLGFLLVNMVTNLQKQGMNLSFGFLDQISGFDISESLIPYNRAETYIAAFAVGLLNTLLVSILGIIFATILGVIVGVARLSQNFLINRLARIYIEVLRNIPLLVLLVFWYRVVFLKLPRVGSAIILPGPIYLSNRGVAFPWGLPTETFRYYLIFVAIGLLAAIGVGVFATRRGRRTGRTPLWLPWSFLIFVAALVIGWFVLPQPPLTPDYPQVGGLNLTGGKVLSPEFMALLSGLVIYTAAFIAEVVRAGIQSVTKGQTEAAHALGLSGFQTLRLIIFPQALRVIIPPLTSQYLNLTKNSSLAVAIAFPDLFYVSNTILNQSGRAVEVISLVMLVYLTISLVTAAFMNWYNRSIRLVER
jgi:general L-amino acid transport system permease protein